MVPGAGIEPARGCPRGIFVPATVYTAALARRIRRLRRIWGLDFTFALPRLQRASRFRQGPSSLYTFRSALRPLGLARYCSHRHMLLVHRL